MPHRRLMVVLLIALVSSTVVTIPWAAPVGAATETVTFGVTGSAQSWTVPGGVTSVNVDVQGASGGKSTWYEGSPGLGGRVQATMTVVPGATLRIFVGSSPDFATGGAGFNGGGESGGGASDIRSGGTALSNRVVVAGGGGGGGYGGDSCSWLNGGGPQGGHGGGLVGQAGGSTWEATGGAGGTETGGGAGGAGPGGDGVAGSLGTGGDSYYGGGGGGYYGGGSGAYGSTGWDDWNNCDYTNPSGGGGGGSSFASPWVTDVTHTQGYRSGDGVVAITYATSEPTNGASSEPSISADGNYVAFSSLASNLVDNDQNGLTDVFVYDRDAGQTSRVSMSSTSTDANGASSSPALSADGGFVAFQSSATNLVSGDTNGVSDVFLRDVVAGTTSTVSVGSAGQANGANSQPAISADGRYVAFQSSATNLVSGDTNGVSDVFRDVVAGTTIRVYFVGGATQTNGASSQPAISADGRYVAFQSLASNLVTGDTNGASDVFLRDVVAGTTARVSVKGTKGQANGASSQPAISADGRYVAFQSLATSLVTGDTNAASDVFLRDVQAASTSRVSLTALGDQATGSSSAPSVSADGRYVAFTSDAADVFPGDSNGVIDVFERDRVSSKTRLLSFDEVRGPANKASGSFAMSSDATFAAFVTLATNFEYDPNELADVYLHFWDSIGQAETALAPAASAESSSLDCSGGSGSGFSAMTSEAVASASAPHDRCIVVQISQSQAQASAQAVASQPVGQVDCEDGDVNVGAYPMNISTAGLNAVDSDVLRTFARRSNSWLAQAWRIGEVKVKPTKGKLRDDANAAAQLERNRAEAAGTPYSGQVGHVPDTAVTGQPIPPCGWLDMPGTTNQRAGGGLSYRSRVSSRITHILIDGALP